MDVQHQGVFLTGSPVIVDGVVYAATRDENGDGNSAVSAVELSSGRQLWTHRMPTSVHGSIAVANGKVFASTLRGKLYALDTTTGDELWKLAPEDAPEPYNQRAYGYYGVTFADGKVLWPYQSRHGKGSQGLLSAVDAQTGKVVWESPMSGATMADGTPTVSDGKVFVGSQTADRVLAYDLETGKRLWQGQEALGGWQDGIPSAANGRVFIGSNNRIIARDADSGQELWRFQSPHPSLVNGGATPAAPAIDGDIVYMGFPSGAVTALDARTGAVIWDRKLPGKLDMGGVHSSPRSPGSPCSSGRTTATSTPSTSARGNRCGSTRSAPGSVPGPRSAGTPSSPGRTTATSTPTLPAVGPRRSGAVCAGSSPTPRRERRPTASR